MAVTSLQLVRDEDDRKSARRQAPQHGEQALDLAGRQHRGRLVEDEDAGAAIEHLQDLDALLLADREAVDAPVGVDREPALGHQPVEPRRGLGETQRRRPSGPRAEHDVLEHGQALGEREMLVHHADAGGERGAAASPAAEAGARRRQPRPGSCPHRPRSGRTGCSSASSCRRRSRRAAPGSRPRAGRVDVASLATSAPKRFVTPAMRRTRMTGRARGQTSHRACDERPNPSRRRAGFSRQARLAGQLDFGSASLTLTRNRPSRISFSLSLTAVATSGGTSFSSMASVAPPWPSSCTGRNRPPRSGLPSRP